MTRQRGSALIIYGLVAIGVLGALGGLYWKVDNGGYQRGKAEIQALWDAANEAARQREAAASAKAAADLAAERKKRRIVIQERVVYVDKIVDRPVYRNQCLDADGLRCLESAILGKSAVGCKPDGAVSATAPANRD